MKRKCPILAYWCIFLFFVTLFTERVISVVLTLNDENIIILNSYFNIYTYGIVYASLCVSLIMLIVMNWPFLMALFSDDEDIQNRVSLKRISVMIGVLLVSGMVHTAYTMTWLQFVAYGFLICGLIVATVNNLKHDRSDIHRWLSLGYMLAYSMAVPVVYESHIQYAFAFHIIEAAGSLIMIGFFTWMTYRVLSGRAGNLFYIEPLHIAMFINIAIIWMRWNEEKNYFLIISMGIAIAIWIAGHYIPYRKK